MDDHSLEPPAEPAADPHPAFEFGAALFCEYGLPAHSANLLGLALCGGEEYIHTYLGADWADRQNQMAVTERLAALRECTTVDCYGIDEPDLVGRSSSSGGDEDDDESDAYQPGIIHSCEDLLVLDNADELGSEFQALYEPMSRQQYTAFHEGTQITRETACTVLAISQLEERAEKYSTYEAMISFNQKEMSLFDLVILPTIGPTPTVSPDSPPVEQAAERIRHANTYEPSVPDDSAALIEHIEQNIADDTIVRRYSDVGLLARAAARLRHSETVDESDVKAASKLLFDTDIMTNPAADADDTEVLITGAGQPDLNRHQFTLQVLETMQEEYFIGVPYDEILTIMEDYLIAEEEVEATLETLKDNGDVRKFKDKYRAT